MSPQKKKMVAIALVAGIAVVIAVVAALVIPARARERERLAKLNAQPSRLEKQIQAMNNAGGFTEAARDGSLLAATHDPERAKAEASLEELRSRHQADLRGQAMLDYKGPEAREWVKSSKDAHLQGHSHDASVKIIEDCYANGVTDVKLIGKPVVDVSNMPMTAGIIGTLPAEPEKRKKIFDWSATVGKTIPSANSYDQGQKHITLEFTE
jgi:hypothetical protein